MSEKRTDYYFHDLSCDVDGLEEPDTYFVVCAFDSSDAVLGEINFESFDAASRVAKLLLSSDVPKTAVVLERFDGRHLESTELEKYLICHQVRKQIDSIVF